MDPAEVARARTAEVEDLLREAQTREREAADYFEMEQEEAENYALTAANNLRLRALCKHLRLPEPNQSGTDEDEGRG
jgi:hypothetical protein